MTVKVPRVFDGSALVALFAGHRELNDMLEEANRDSGDATLILPATAIADAEAEINAGRNGWDAILLTRHVLPLALSEYAAIEIGTWPGRLSSRHVVHEAQAMRATVVTRQPGVYTGLDVPLLVV